MKERAPGEVDALANGHADLSVIIDKIRDNLRARQQAPDYDGFLTEEEADALFGYVLTEQQNREEAEARADSADSEAEDLRGEVDDLESDVRNLKDEVDELQERIKELEEELSKAQGANS